MRREDWFWVAVKVIGLWLAVERGLLCHTTSAPVTFRAPPTPAVARRSSP